MAVGEELLVRYVKHTFLAKISVSVAPCDDLVLSRSELVAHEATKQFSVVESLLARFLDLGFLRGADLALVERLSDLIKGMDTVGLCLEVVFEAGHLGFHLFCVRSETTEVG